MGCGTGCLVGGSYRLMGPQVLLLISVQLSGRAVSFPLSVDTFDPKQKACGGSKLATSTLTSCFADLSSMICVTLARHLTCVPATLRCDGSSWLLSYLRGGCRAEGDGGDSDASEKHKALDRNGFDLFHLLTSYLYSSVHTHLGEYQVFH